MTVQSFAPDVAAPVAQAMTAQEECARACLIPAEWVTDATVPIAPARVAELGVGVAAAVEPARAATASGTGGTLGRLLEQLVAVDLGLRLLQAEVGALAVDVVRRAGGAVLADPDEFAAGLGDGFTGALVDTFWQPIKTMASAVVWAAEVAGCDLANSLRTYFQAETGVELFSGNACAPYEELARRLHDLKQQLGDLIEHELRGLLEDPALWISELLSGVLLTLQLLCLALGDRGREAIARRADDAKAVGEVVGVLLAQVVVEVLPLAAGAFLQATRAARAVAVEVDAAVLTTTAISDAVAASRVISGSPEVASLTDVLPKTSAALGRVVGRHPTITDNRLQAARRSGVIGKALIERVDEVHGLVAAQAKRLFLKVGIYADLQPEKISYNAQARLVVYLEALRGGSLTRAEEIRLTAQLSEEVFENAHIIDGRFYEQFKEGFKVLLGTDREGREYMRSFLVPASEHTRSAPAYFEKLLGWRPDPEDIGGQTDNITKVFLRRIVKEGAKPQSPKDVLFVVKKDTKLSQLYRWHAQVWEKEFPVFFKAIAQVLADDIARLEALGL